MAKISANFELNTQTPNFARDQFATTAAMKECTFIDEGHISYCVATGKHYEFKSANTSDSTTGKWREINFLTSDLFASLTNPFQYQGSTAIVPTGTMKVGYIWRASAAITIPAAKTIDAKDEITAIGDLIVCVEATTPKFTVLQNNLNDSGIVYKSGTISANHVAVFNDTNGTIKDSGKTVDDFVQIEATSINGNAALSKNGTAIPVVSSNGNLSDSGVTKSDLTELVGELKGTALSASSNTETATAGTLKDLLKKFRAKNNTFAEELTAATSSTLGGVKIGYTEINNNFALNLDSSSKGYVTIPYASEDGFGILDSDQSWKLGLLTDLFILTNSESDFCNYIYSMAHEDVSLAIPVQIEESNFLGVPSATVSMRVNYVGNKCICNFNIGHTNYTYIVVRNPQSGAISSVLYFQDYIADNTSITTLPNPIIG